MPRHAFIALGSNTTVVTGEGVVYGVITSGANGGTIVLQDSIGIGVSPNYVTIGQSVPSNILFAHTLTTAPATFDLRGIPFQDGLTVAATSNAAMTVVYDGPGA